MKHFVTVGDDRIEIPPFTFCHEGGGPHRSCDACLALAEKIDGDLAIVHARGCAATKCQCPGARRVGCPCPRCHGAGWYPDSEGDFADWREGDYRERYCGCADGARLRERDGE